MRLGKSRRVEASALLAATAALLPMLLAIGVGCSSTPKAEDRPLDADPPGPVEVGKKAAKRPAGLDEAVELVKAGKFADAIPKLRKALEEEPKSAEAAFYLGMSIEQTGGDKKEAEAMYKQALAFDPKLIEAANNLAAIYLEEPPRPDQAIPVLSKALSNEPDNVTLLTNLGYAYGLKGDIAQASKAYEAAIAKEPSPQLLFSYGTMLFENKQAEKAAPHLTKAADGIDDVPTLVTIARMLGPGKAFTDCVKVLDKAIAKKGDVAEFYVRRGLCKHELDQEEAASKDFEQAIKTDPQFQAAHYYLGVSLTTQKKVARGREHLKKAYELGRETPIGKQAKDKLDGKKPEAKAPEGKAPAGGGKPAPPTPPPPPKK